MRDNDIANWSMPEAEILTSCYVTSTQHVTNVSGNRPIFTTPSFINFIKNSCFGPGERPLPDDMRKILPNVLYYPTANFSGGGVQRF